MSWLNNIKLAPKLISVVVLMAAVLGGLLLMALDGFDTVQDTVHELQKGNERLVNAGRANANLLAFARNVEFLPMGLKPEQRDAYEKAAADELGRLQRRLDNLAKVAVTDDGRRNVQAVRAAIERYLPAYRKVQEQARRGDLDGATETAFTAADAIAEARRVLREFEARNDKMMEEAIANAEVVHERNDQKLITVSLAGMLAGLAASLALIILGVTRPLQRMTSAMLSVAGGNLETAVPAVGQKDEIGQLAGALEQFKTIGQENRRMETGQKQAEAKAVEQRRADMHRLADGFEAAVGGIVQAVSSSATQLETAATTLTHTADTTQRLSTVVAGASEEASSNVQSVASATDELSASVSEIGRQVHESSRIALEAVKQAEATDARIAELSDAAQRIGDVVKLITAVSEQTNLLALNATIEAARAGEAGRGFAVVASEVKALAAQTGRATGDISQQIARMQAATEDSVAAIKEIGGTIARISEIAATIAASVEEQGAATQEIARNVQEAARGTSEVATNITAVNKGAGETGSASTQVLSSARALSSEGSKLRLELDKFLGTVRAA